MEVHSCVGLQTLSLTSKQIPIKDPVNWNSVIKRHAELKNDQAILTAYNQMETLNISPDSKTLPLILKACSKLQAVETGKRVHSWIRNQKSIEDVRVRTALVNFYCKCGFLIDARNLFDEMSERDVVLWNTMIDGYVGCCRYEEAILLFMQMGFENLKPTSVTLVTLIVACGEMLELRLGQEIHGHCLRNGLLDTNCHLGAALIGFYQQFNLRVCRTMFDSVVMRNVVSWNTMLQGYFDAGDYFEAFNLFVQMLKDGVKCDTVTMLIMQACSEIGSLDMGIQMHQLAIKFGYAKDLYTINALLNMYSKNGCLESAYKLFESVPMRDSAMWNSMIYAYFEFGWHEDAWSMFSRMQSDGFRANEFTLNILLSMCSDSANNLIFGKHLHAKVIKSGFDNNISIGNALLSLYSELSCTEDAERIFSELTNPNVISFNTIILALASNRSRSQAWSYFQHLIDSPIKPNSHTIISILAVCVDKYWLKFGRSLHGFVIKDSIEVNVELNTALTEMYVNCGDVTTAWNLFDRCSNRDLISWNSLIGSLIRNNHANQSLLFFRRMISEVKPSSVTVIQYTWLMHPCRLSYFRPKPTCLHHT
ncbi:hypothetical protein Nepgr_001883 [Nepenthes gracilis]|uniref:Pentatricopeptide repeat-containing protein n=1 Tax=Nepenthes gracilis TaxID=150966 RepID=A0AAD3P588_NEPGR|nr:hypothetical protein Nepgr_001883 [Nepenthes gracilis]